MTCIHRWPFAKWKYLSDLHRVCVKCGQPQRHATGQASDFAGWEDADSMSWLLEDLEHVKESRNKHQGKKEMARMDGLKFLNQSSTGSAKNEG